MSTRYSIVTLAYPPSYRRAHVGELVQTANELEAGRRWSARQSWSLLVEGLRTRARLSSRGTPSQVWGSAMAVALGLSFLFRVAFPLTELLVDLGARTGVTIFWPYSPWLFLLQGLVPLGVLCWSTRWPSAVVVTAVELVVAVYMLQGDTGVMQGGIQSVLASSLLRISLAWWLALRTDGRRAFSPVKALFLLATIVGQPILLGSLGLGTVAILTQIGTLIVGLSLLVIDPRPLIVATTLFALTSSANASLSFIRGEALEAVIAAAGTAALISITVLLSRFGTRRLLAT